LGWILTALTPGFISKVQAWYVIVTNRQLHEQFNRLWQLDDNFAISSTYSPEEKICEQHFIDNISRNPQGRYVVKLPIKEYLFPKLGDSHEITFKRLRALERRFSRNPLLKQQYSQE